MADKIGSLIVSLQADVARFDSDLKRATSLVESSMGKIQNAISSTMSAFGALGVGLSVAGFAAMAKQVIDSAAALDDLAEKTGASVESLSKFAGVARITGQDMGTIEQAMGKLSKSIVEAQDGSSNAARAFAAFGLSIKNADGSLKNSGDLMAELAIKQQEFGDGAGKAAAFMELLGRSGSEVIPFMNDYVRLSDQVSTTTAEQAAQAETLKIELGLMTESWNRLLREAILPTIPHIRGLIEDVRSLGRAFSESLPATSPFSAFLDSFRDTVRRTAAEIAYIKQAWENLKTWWGGGTPTMTPEAAYNATYLAEQNKALARATAELPPLMEATATAAEKMGVKFAASSGAVKGAAKETEGYREEMKRLKSQLDAEAKALDAYIKLWEGYEKDAAKFAEDRAKAAENDALAREASIRSIYEQVNELENEVKMLGLSNEERERSIKLLELESSGLDANSEEYRNLTERINEAFNAKKAFNESKALAEEFQRQADTITQSLTDALLRGFESGKDFAENFVATLKNLFGTLILRPVIQAIVAPVAGGMAGLFPGAANAGGGLGGLGGAGGFDISSLLGGVGSYFGGWGELLGTGATSYASAAGGMAAFNIANMLGLSTTTAAGLASTLSLGLPILGVAAMAYMMLKKPRGGPKEGGFASDIPDLERFFTPSSRDTDVRQIVDATADSFAQIMRTLGGTSTAQFAFGFDTDPRGTASDRISALARVNGQDVYSIRDLETGRDSEATAEALSLAARRALLAALQASDLPQDIARLIDSVEAGSASADAIDDILAIATAFGSLSDLFNSDVLEDGLTAYEDSLLGVNQALFRQIDAVSELVAEYDGSADAATALATATQGVYASAVQAVAQINALRSQLSDLFAGSATNYRLAGMSNAEQRDYLQAEIERLTGQLQGATDASAIARFAALIDQSQQRLWSLLTQEEQVASAESFAVAAEAAGQIADERLSLVLENVQNAVDEMLTGVRDVMLAAADTQQVAADTIDRAAGTIRGASDAQVTAGQLQLAAARTPITINLRGVPSEVGP